MQDIDFWYLFYLHWKKMSFKRLILILLLIANVQFASAQGNWGGGVDDQPLHFGYSFHMVTSQFRIKNDPAEKLSATTSGFGMGFLADLRLADNANLRFNPVLNFADREMVDLSSANQKIESLTIDFPLGFKFKSDKKGNFRAYMIAGIKYSRDITKKETYEDNPVKNTRNIFSYETGVGLDIYLEFFKLSPELKLTNSFHNVIDSKLSPGYNPHFLKNFQFSLFFE